MAFDRRTHNASRRQEIESRLKSLNSACEVLTECKTSGVSALRCWQRGSRPERAPTDGIAIKVRYCRTVGARVTTHPLHQGSVTGRNRPPLPLGVRYRVAQAVSHKSQDVVGGVKCEVKTKGRMKSVDPARPANQDSTCIYEDSTCVMRTSEEPNPETHADSPSALLMLLVWIVRLRVLLRCEEVVVLWCVRRGFQPLTVVPPKRVSAWFFKDSDNSHSGQAVGEIIERVQLINCELPIRGQENGDNQIDYLRPNSFEVFCSGIVYKRSQALGTVSSCSRSIRQRGRCSL